MNYGTPIDPDHILPGDRIIAWGPGRNGNYTEHEYTAYSKRHRILYAEGYKLIGRHLPDTTSVDDVFELRLNLTDKQIEPAARELFNINDRGNPRGYIPFEQITEDEYNDYMTTAQYAVEGFLKGLEKAEDD